MRLALLLGAVIACGTVIVGTIAATTATMRRTESMAVSPVGAFAFSSSPSPSSPDDHAHAHARPRPGISIERTPITTPIEPRVRMRGGATPESLAAARANTPIRVCAYPQSPCLGHQVYYPPQEWTRGDELGGWRYCDLPGLLYAWPPEGRPAPGDEMK